MIFLKLFFTVFLFVSPVYVQDTRSQIIQQEEQDLTLPPLPSTTNQTAVSDPATPQKIDVNSDSIVVTEKVVPNEGNPYFVFSFGLTPYQLSIGILKYFIAEWWGQIDIDLTFIPNVPNDNYYTAYDHYKPYVAFKIVTGYSFYQQGIYDLGVFAKVQFAFVSTDDIPVIPSAGFRFAFDFFYVDLGLGYAVGTSKDAELLFSGLQPAISFGFRF